jgi:hypothetical protein
MIYFLSAVVPQDPLVWPRGPALHRAQSLSKAAEEGEQSPAQPESPAQQQQQRGWSDPEYRPPKQQRKRKQPTQSTGGQAGRPPLPPPVPQQRPADHKRRVGVVFYEDTQTWAGAAAGGVSAGQLVPLRVDGLPTAEQAEVARDLLAVWSWLAQGGVLAAAQQGSFKPFVAAYASNGSVGFVRQASTASSSLDAVPAEQAGPAVPPLNHPLR